MQRKCDSGCIDFEKNKSCVTYIRSAKEDDNYGASNIVLPCPHS
jgi:hypothetical protein